MRVYTKVVNELGFFPMPRQKCGVLTLNMKFKSETVIENTQKKNVNMQYFIKNVNDLIDYFTVTRWMFLF